MPLPSWKKRTVQRKGMCQSLSQTKGEWVQASSAKISGTVWVDDTLLTQRRLVTMSGYFVKLFIFLYFYETKTKSINYKTQKKKKNEMIIKKIRASIPLTRVLQNGDVEPKTKNNFKFICMLVLLRHTMSRTTGLKKKQWLGVV